MKKLICLLLALLMITSVSLVACKKDDEPDDDYNDDLLFGSTTASTEAPTTATETTEPTSWEFTDVDEMVYVKNCLKVNFRKTPSTSSKDNIAGALDFGDEKTYKRVKFNEVWSGLEIDDIIPDNSKSSIVTTISNMVSGGHPRNSTKFILLYFIIKLQPHTLLLNRRPTLRYTCNFVGLQLSNQTTKAYSPPRLDSLLSLSCCPLPL